MRHLRVHFQWGSGEKAGWKELSQASNQGIGEVKLLKTSAFTSSICTARGAKEELPMVGCESPQSSTGREQKGHQTQGYIKVKRSEMCSLDVVAESA